MKFNDNASDTQAEFHITPTRRFSETASQKMNEGAHADAVHAGFVDGTGKIQHKFDEEQLYSFTKWEPQTLTKYYGISQEDLKLARQYVANTKTSLNIGPEIAHAEHTM